MFYAQSTYSDLLQILLQYTDKQMHKHQRRKHTGDICPHNVLNSFVMNCKGQTDGK